MYLLHRKKIDIYSNISLFLSYSEVTVATRSGLYPFVCFPVAQLVEHGVSNAKIMGSIPRESKSW